MKKMGQIRWDIASKNCLFQKLHFLGFCGDLGFFGSGSELKDNQRDYISFREGH